MSYPSCFNCLVPACTSHTSRATTGTTARPDSSDGYEAIEGPTILHWEFLMTDSWKKVRNENECYSNWAILSLLVSIPATRLLCHNLLSSHVITMIWSFISLVLWKHHTDWHLQNAKITGIIESFPLVLASITPAGQSFKAALPVHRIWVVSLKLVRY